MYFLSLRFYSLYYLLQRSTRSATDLDSSLTMRLLTCIVVVLLCLRHSLPQPETTIQWIPELCGSDQAEEFPDRACRTATWENLLPPDGQKFRPRNSKLSLACLLTLTSILFLTLRLASFCLLFPSFFQPMPAQCFKISFGSQEGSPNTIKYTI